MPQIPDVPRARLLLQSYGGWIGPPAIKLGSDTGKLIDGRKRVRAFNELCMPGSPPVLVARNKREAARLLLLAHHVRRAHDLLGDSIPYNVDTAILLRVPPEIAAMLVQHVNRHQGRRHRPRPRRRQEVIDKLRALYLDCLDGHRQLTLADLREVLGDWA